MKELTPTQRKNLEKEEVGRIRTQKLKRIERELIPFCNKNRLDYQLAYKLVISRKIIGRDEYKSSHILPYHVYEAFKKYLEEDSHV